MDIKNINNNINGLVFQEPPKIFKVQLPSGLIQNLSDMHKEDFNEVKGTLKRLREELEDARNDIWSTRSSIAFDVGSPESTPAPSTPKKETTQTPVSVSPSQPSLGDLVYSKITKKGPYVIIGEFSKLAGPQRIEIECWLVKDTKDRERELPKHEAVFKDYEGVGEGTINLVIGSILGSIVTTIVISMTWIHLLTVALR